MVRLLLTHGRGLSGRDRERLRRKFTRYLREGFDAVGYHDIEDDQIDFLYYGDLLERAEAEQELPAVAAARVDGANARPSLFDGDVETLRRHLDAAGIADARVCSLVEERAGHVPSVTDDSDAQHRQAAVDAAIEDRTAQLLENPAELLDVLEREFGPAYDDDEAVRGRLRELDERLGHDPREAAARRAAEEERADDPGHVEALLREWIVDPATDAIASLRAVSRVIHEYGLDLRSRLADWRRARWSDALTRFEGTDFGRQWSVMFDIIAVLANVSMLDGFYIARRMADVENYFRDASIRDDVRGYFRDALEGRDEPTLLVAHSLGSVIGYDVLREYPDLRVPGLVSLGSPLSIGHFRRNLARRGESGDDLPVPQMLTRWVNVYSELDPLTLGSGIERYFQGGGDESGRGPVDREAENTGYLDAHSPDQYLRANATSTAIIQMIASARVHAGA
ncbi:MAG TPA: hypothetical protein VD789_12465 [Thermomicrobiales bacterium]|nr:hypothetical protein [Thermomicrobiales bacterium]